jgi:AraC family transcriptional regulator
MTRYRIIEKPAFDVVGKKTWISGQNNELFGQFWVQCREEGLFEIFDQLAGNQPGAQTKSSVLGISCVERDPANRAFYYLIGIEKPAGMPEKEPVLGELETYHVPASKWAVFECVGKVPEAIVKSEIYAFTEWLPSSGFEHAKAPEMEVYFPGNDGNSEDSYCEFWLPITERA